MEIALLSQAVSLFVHADTDAKGERAEDSESFASLLGEFDTQIEATVIDIDIVPVHPVDRRIEAIRGEGIVTLPPIISEQEVAGTPAVDVGSEAGNNFESAEETLLGAKQHIATGLDVLTKKTLAEKVTFEKSTLPENLLNRADLGVGDFSQESSDPGWPLTERGAIAHLAKTAPVFVENARDAPVSVRSEDLIASEGEKGSSPTQIAQDKAPHPLPPKVEKATTDDVIGKSDPVPVGKATLEPQKLNEAKMASWHSESKSARAPSISNSEAPMGPHKARGHLSVEPEPVVQDKRPVSAAQIPRENPTVAPHQGAPLADIAVALRTKPPARVQFVSDIVSSNQSVDPALETEAEIKVQFAPVSRIEDRPIPELKVSDLKRPEPPSAPKQVTEHIQVLLRAKNTGATEITLQPEELGKVRLQISNAENGLVVSIQAERNDTLEQLRRQVESLAADLAGQGHDAARFDFGAWSDQGGSETDTDEVSEETATLPIGTEKFVPAPPSQLSRKSDGSLDIRL